MDSAPAAWSGHPWLFLDASGLTTRVGLWQDSRWLAFREDPAPALESLFTTTRAVLAEASLSLPAIGGFLYVSGPGSVLGLRLAAMAIRTWEAGHPALGAGLAGAGALAAGGAPAPAPRPVLACGALHLAAALALAGGASPPFATATDARQGRWHWLSVGSPALGSLAPQEISADELAHSAGQQTGPLFYLPARKTWQPPPRPFSPLPAVLRVHPAVVLTPGLFAPVPLPIPFAGAAPEYKKWAGASA
jgi:tRNA threonylcarbamoyladenosine biosynthesis protein TsaB